MEVLNRQDQHTPLRDLLERIGSGRLEFAFINLTSQWFGLEIHFEGAKVDPATGRLKINAFSTIIIEMNGAVITFQPPLENADGTIPARAFLFEGERINDLRLKDKELRIESERGIIALQYGEDVHEAVHIGFPDDPDQYIL